MSISLFISKLPVILLLSVISPDAHTIPAHDGPVNKDRSYIVLPASEDDAEDVIWAERIHIQLNHRTGKNGAVTSDPGQNNLFRIITDVDPSLAYSYGIRRTTNGIILSAKDRRTMTWLTYQYISKLAETDSRISADDLPPAIIKTDYDNEHNFSFEYRDIYTPSNSKLEQRTIIGTDHVDDWGLWGHNLKKILGADIPKDVLAQANGVIHPEQLCFSSEVLYQRIESYIIDQYGWGTNELGVRFCIMPEDNPTVCLCPKCLHKGNTPTNATPAVTALIKRLADRFPNHLFFTSSYLSTETPPNEKMPSNTGVIISAITLPLKSHMAESQEADTFRHKIAQWKNATNKLYVWDYMCNFDDYLTPFPVLYLLKERLVFFHDLKINGVFYNGSGYDFSSFEDLQTQVIASLLADCSSDPGSLIKAYFKKFYPNTGSTLSDYYLSIEEKALASPHALLFYAGIEDAVNRFLNASDFLSFRDTLTKLSKNTDGPERAKLNKLLTALNFTALELMRLPGICPYNQEVISNTLTDLKGYRYFDDMSNYRESNGAISEYISNWTKYPVVNDDGTNLRTVHIKTRQQDGMKDPAILQDGYYGFPSDYHTGWYIFSKDTLTFETVVSKNGTTKLKIGFLYAPHWHITMPNSILVYKNGELIKTITPEQLPSSNDFTKNYLSIETVSSAGDTLKYCVIQDGKSRQTSACDEIEVYEKP